MRLVILFCALALASAANAHSGSAAVQGNTDAGPVAVQGFQDMSCGAWVSSTSNLSARAQYLAWFSGFVSGVNFVDRKHQIGLAQMPSDDTLTLYVDKYCRDNPLTSFVGAAFELVREIRPHQPKN